MAKSLEGACHCGAMGVALEIEDDTALSPRHCGCSFCQKHGSLYVSAPSGRLTITLAEPDRVSRYAFGHKTATFLICSRCGVEAAAVCEMDGRLYAVLNANLLSPPLAVDRASVPHRGLRGRGCPRPAGPAQAALDLQRHHRRGLIEDSAFENERRRQHQLRLLNEYPDRVRGRRGTPQGSR